MQYTEGMPITVNTVSLRNHTIFFNVTLQQTKLKLKINN